jgi:heme exporter protein CcmD
MSVNFADPDWAFIWPAYAITVAAFGALAAGTIWRLRKWARNARDGPR